MKKGEAVSAPEFKLVEKSGESLECRAGEYASALHQLSTDYKTCGWMLTRDAALWGLKQGEEERKLLRDLVNERNLEFVRMTQNYDRINEVRNASQAKCEALEAERDRMRAALGKIASCTPVVKGDCPSIARDALAKDCG